VAETIIGITALNNRLSAISGPAANRALMMRLQGRTITAMKARIPRKTSTTSRTLHAGIATPTSAEVLGSMNAIWLDRGTRPHRIPKSGNKLLAWPATAAGRRLSGRARASTKRGKHGGFIYAMHVNHPGTRPQPYIDASMKEALARSGLSDAVIQRWNDAA